MKRICIKPNTKLSPYNVSVPCLLCNNILFCDFCPLFVTEHIRGPFCEAVAEGEYRTMPMSFMAAAPVIRRGVLCLGDALNIRHPVTVSGMSVAFKDVLTLHELVRHITDLGDYKAVESAARQFYLRRKANHSFVINVLSMALFEIFTATNGWFLFFFHLVHFFKIM